MLARGNLVANGDFSLPAIDPDGGTPYTFPESWTANVLPDATYSDVQRDAYDVLDPCMHFFIWSDCPGPTQLTLTQPISLPAGQYRLAFEYVFYTYGGGSGLYESDTFNIVLNDGHSDVMTQQVQTDTGASMSSGFYDDLHADKANPYTWLFSLASPEPSLILEFQLDRDRFMPNVETDLGLVDVDLSEVGVSAVPAPGAALLGAVGLSCAGWRLRRGRS